MNTFLNLINYTNNKDPFSANTEKFSVSDASKLDLTKLESTQSGIPVKGKIMMTKTINLTTTSRIANLIYLTKIASSRKIARSRNVPRVTDLSSLDTDTLDLLHDIKTKALSLLKEITKADNVSANWIIK